MLITRSIKYIVKIPDRVNVFYCDKKDFLILRGPVSQKSLRIETKIKIKRNKIEVTSLALSTVKNILQKKLKAVRGTTLAMIKQLLIDATSNSYKSLNLIGIGYKAFFIENNIILLKLGYSHPIYFNIPVNLKISCLKLTKIFIRGNSYKNVTAVTSWIRTKKLPEPYKGKGILYKNEKIKLKEGKKI